MGGGGGRVGGKGGRGGGGVEGGIRSLEFSTVLCLSL